MINELFYMNGYGLYVWSAFFIYSFKFYILYVIIKIQYIKEKK